MTSHLNPSRSAKSKAGDAKLAANPYEFTSQQYGSTNPYSLSSQHMASSYASRRPQASMGGYAMSAYPNQQFAYSGHGAGEGKSEWFLGEPTESTSQKTLKAVHVGPCFCNGGAEQQIMDLLKFLNPTRIQLDKLIVTDDHAVDPALRARVGVEVEVGGAEAVRRASEEYDVMLFWGIALDQWLADYRPKLGVYLAHGDGSWTQSLLDDSLKVTDHVIAVSQRVKETVCSGAPTTVILNGVDAARLAQSRSRRDVRESLGFSDDDFVLGYVGRYSPEKRAHLLIETVRELPPYYKALFVGWGPLEFELMQMANDFIPGRYAFASANEYLGDFYHAMDSLCLLSTQEGFALVMLEAMMCGLPVAATPVGAVPDVIQDGRNGVVVSDEPAEIANTIAQLRDLPGWSRGLADAGRAYAEQHGHARRMARDYERLLSQLWEQKFGTAA